ncbi:MAG TPA: hypothetical protein VLW85_07905 [Myxococcales bacterium]|nr:hypothetical protein [Myxococcales bacterium]
MAVKNNHDAWKSQVEKTSSGLEKKFGAKGKLDVNDAVYTVEEINKMLKKSVSDLVAVEEQKAKLKQMLQAQRASMAAAKQLLFSIQRFLQGKYGPRNEVLTEFGFSPLKQRAKSSKTKAAAADKEQATRAARHIMGARQREQIVVHDAPANGAGNGAANGGVKNGAEA